MKTHDALIEVWQVTTGTWTWLCDDHCHPTLLFGRDYPTHTEALAAARKHCTEAGAA